MNPEQIKSLTEYCENNPVIIYADYRDELSSDQISALLERGAESFWESAWDSEIYIQDSWYEYGFKEYVKEALKDCDISDDDKAADIIQENLIFDFSDFWKSCARNTQVNITLTPINPETDEPFYTVHYHQSFSDMLANARALRKYFGMRDFRKIESCYDHEVLRICGHVDLCALIKNGMPEQWRINPGDNCVFHTSWNGSGALGDFSIRKSAVLKCRVELDAANRYGVDAVYGFCGSFWRETELTPVYNTKEGV